MLEIQNITKYFLKPAPSYKKINYYLTGKIEEKFKQAVLSDVSLSVKKGESVGIFGKNGAGKTTLLKIVSDIIIPDKGLVTIAGRHNRLNLDKIGLVLNNDRSFFWRLSAYENLLFFARLYDLSAQDAKQRIEWINQILDLRDILPQRFDKLSNGMKQKVNLARALLHKPEILLLDEPTISLDIINQQKFLSHVQKLKEEFKLTILWSSHHLEEIGEACDRIMVIDAGRFVWEGATREFKKIFFDYHYAVTLKTPREGKNEVQISDLDQIYDCDILKCNIGNISFKKEFIWERLAQFRSSQEEKCGDSSPLTHPESAKKKCSLIAAIYTKIKRICSLSILFLRKDFNIERNYKLSFLLDILGIVFSATSFYFISKLFYQKNIDPSLIKGDYFSFVLIGLAFLGFINTAMNGLTSNLRQAQVLGIIEQIMVSPITVFEYIFSSSSYLFLFSAVRFLIYLAIGLLLGANFKINITGLYLALILFLLSLGVFSSLGVLSASFTMIFKRGDPLNFFVGNLMGLVGEVYYPVKILPSILRLVSFLIPLRYAIKGVRLCLFSHAGLSEILPFILILLTFFLVLFPLSLCFYKWALFKAKKEATLSFY